MKLVCNGLADTQKFAKEFENIFKNGVIEGLRWLIVNGFEFGFLL